MRNKQYLASYSSLAPPALFYEYFFTQSICKLYEPRFSPLRVRRKFGTLAIK